MKRFAVALFKFIIWLSVFFGIIYIILFFATKTNRVLLSIGWYDEKDFWTHGWRDYTDFGVYHCPSAKLKYNPYFSKVTSDDIDDIGEYLDNFEKWVEEIRSGDTNDELVVNYSFDRTVIDTDDYFYIDSEGKGSKFSNYDVWIFDTQTDTLYFFHNND